MNKRLKLAALLGVVLTLLVSSFSPMTTLARPATCTVTLSPHTITAATSGTFSFAISNNGSSDFQWVHIMRPSSDFTVTGIAQSGWTDTTTSIESTLVDGTLSPTNTFNLQIAADSADVQAPAASWTVEVSYASDGSSPITCGGDTSTDISGAPPSNPTPTISDVTLQSLTTTGVTVLWTTNTATSSRVNYGLTTSYGHETDNGATLTTSHSVHLTGLIANTGYHFQVVSTDAYNVTATSSDSTFLTPTTPVSSPSPTPSSNTPSTAASSSGARGVIPKLTSTETTPPTISLTTSIAKPVAAAPTLAGTADDNAGIYRLDYSIDGGHNWLPITAITPVAAPKTTSKTKSKATATQAVTFTFTPIINEDGDYPLKLRAIDTSGNQGFASPGTIVFDRLPPIVGGNIISAGAQILIPNTQGTLTTLAGLDQKITLATGGGPTSITLAATRQDGRIKKDFHLTRSPATGLWSGIVSFQDAGTYTLAAQALDGAGNHTTRDLNDILALNPAVITDQATHQPIGRAKVTLYYLEPTTSQWTIWDSASYGQHNPQVTPADGSFRFLAPPGQYYLEINAGGYTSLVSHIITLAEPTPIIDTIQLRPAPALHVGKWSWSLPGFAWQQKNLTTGTFKASLSTKQPSLIGQSITNLNLTDSTGHVIRGAELAGKPTVLAFVSTWSPAATEELSGLSDLQATTGIRAIPISTLESPAKVISYSQSGGYKLPWLVDPDGATINRFNLQSLPTNVFINNHGVIKRIIVGTLSKEEILHNLSTL